MIRQSLRPLLPLVISVLMALSLSAGTSASTGLELPSWGEGEPLAGPLGLNPAPPTTSDPVSITIPDAEVDAEVERNQIVDGVMLDPSGPWVVSWYQETGRLGEVDNVVMSGHVDYWDVGPAVFWTVGQLDEGAVMQVRGSDGATYTYAVAWVRTYEVAGLTPETINEIVGPTNTEALTLITCGGDFDYDTGQYLSRTIVRGHLVEVDGVPVTENAVADEQAVSDDDSEVAVAGLDRGAPPDDEGSGAVLRVGGTAAVTDESVNLRSSASTESDIMTTLTEGQEVVVTDGPQDAEGHTWWQIELPDGARGWVAADYLEPS